MGLHNEQLHMVVKVPPSNCLTQSYGWGGGKQRIVGSENGYIS